MGPPFFRDFKFFFLMLTNWGNISVHWLDDIPRTTAIMATVAALTSNKVFNNEVLSFVLHEGSSVLLNTEARLARLKEWNFRLITSFSCLIAHCNCDTFSSFGFKDSGSLQHSEWSSAVGQVTSESILNSESLFMLLLLYVTSHNNITTACNRAMPFTIILNWGWCYNHQ